MLLALVALNLVHPGMVLRGPDSEFPRISRNEKKRLRREKKERKKQAKLSGSDGSHGVAFESLSIQESGAWEDRGTLGGSRSVVV